VRHGISKVKEAGMPTFVFTREETSQVLYAVERRMADLLEEWKVDLDTRLARLDDLRPIRSRLLDALALPEQRESQDGAQRP